MSNGIYTSLGEFNAAYHGMFFKQIYQPCVTQHQGKIPVLIDLFITGANESHITGAPALGDLALIPFNTVDLCALMDFNSLKANDRIV